MLWTKESFELFQEENDLFFYMKDGTQVGDCSDPDFFTDEERLSIFIESSGNMNL